MGTAGQSITLANSIIGVGILAMPFCFQQCGVILATLILLLMGLISRLCCYFLLKSALLARRRNFEFLAFHVFGSAGKMAVEVGIIGFLMGTCIAYFVVVGDLGPQIISKMFNINQSDILRTSIMVIVSLVCVLPLGLLRNVDSLSNVSAATICFYFCLVMKVIAEAASQLLTGEWQTRMEIWKPAGVLQCVPIFSMALFCQTQLFEIFESLPSLSLEKMNLVTKNAINICTGVYFTLGVFGYIAFCSHEISGNILMSLSPTMGSDVIKLGFVMSLAFSFPLIIFPCRASLYSFLYKKVHSSQHDHIINHSIPETTFRCITVAIIAVALFISLLIPNIELVLGFVGSTIGVLICVVFPAACFVNVTFKNTNERLLAKAVVVLGLIIMVLGTYANLQAAETKLDKYDDRFITQERIDKIVEDFFEKREKLEEVRVKPVPGNEPDPLTSHKINIIKDSEVQPPNPVPPDSSNEKIPDIHIEEIEEKKKLKELAPEVKENIDKVSESHPKDVKTKLNEAKLANADSIVGVKKDVPKKSEELKAQANEDKIHIIKQQKLIETIKQHGEEQKELMKEQKEILDEIIKTKKELQVNKNEVENNEAKKIAVESIKQIANMAIQSIEGVSEKPIHEEKDNKESERLDKLTNEAVQEIAKKAEEIIEAIQEIKNPDEPVQKSILEPNNIAKSVQKPVNILNKNIQANSASAQNNIQTNENNHPNQNIQPNIQPKDVPVQNNIEPNLKNHQNIQKPSKEAIGSQQNVPSKVDLNKLNAVNAKSEGLNNKQPSINSETNNATPVKENVAQIVSNNNQRNNIAIPNNKQIVQDVKNPVQVHSHSPDEPQSYKHGEDTLKIPGAKHNNAQNVPLPLALNDLQLKHQANNKEIENVNKKPDADASKIVDNTKNTLKNYVQPNVENNPILDRQKREVDYTIQTSLRAEDQEKCEKVNIPLKDSQEILPKVDLNDVALKKMPLDMLHRIGRSLKKYDIMDKER